MDSDSNLDNLVLAFPCPVQWQTMSGDERVRFCSQCSQKVYNISDMSKKEAEALLKRGLEDNKICVRFFVRADGTIKTENCPRIFKSVRNKVELLRRVISIGITFLFAPWNSAAFAQTAENTTSGDFYEPSGDETLSMGRPAPNEFRELLPQVISVSMRQQPYEGSDKVAKLKSQLSDILRLSRKIDLHLLHDLTQEYLNRNQLDRAFKSSVLENLVALKQPSFSNAEEKRAQLENIRNQILDNLIEQSEIAIHDGDCESAKSFIEKFMEVAKMGQRIIEHNNAVLLGQEKWPMITSNKLEYYIATRKQLDKVHEVLKVLSKAELEPVGLSLFDVEKVIEIKGLPQSM
ncbi:MAG: hypothetical protein KIT34_07885 [Cyanobacteria bacterium TGS_CYA1]|nr:hypothetical protein [Cyanobacteria bacterium TGS_CYA1]